MRKKIPDLTQALAGRFAAHHGLSAGLHPDHIDHLNSMIDRLEQRIDETVAPFSLQQELLVTIPGIGERAAQTIIAEIGVDMSRFPTADHLAS